MTPDGSLRSSPSYVCRNVPHQPNWILVTKRKVNDRVARSTGDDIELPTLQQVIRKDLQ